MRIDSNMQIPQNQAGSSGSTRNTGKQEQTGSGEATGTNTGDSVEVSGEKTVADKIFDLLYIGSDLAQELVASGKIIKDLGLGGGFEKTAQAAGAVAGVYLGIKGTAELKKAIKEKDAVGAIEGAGSISAGGAAVINSATRLAAQAAASGIGGPIAAMVAKSAVIATAGTALGVAYGATEIAVGGKSIYDGIKSGERSKIFSGMLDTAIGVGAIGASIAGSLPLSISLATAYLFRMVFVDGDKIDKAYQTLRGNPDKT
ncbi:MAG: hypothetical protein LWY06_13145 [Firmicutes bacterium]|nr:hypothetical protein [Bacillota bacterium]